MPFNDDSFLKALGIKPAGTIRPEEPQQQCGAGFVQIQVLPSEEPGYVMLSEEDCWAALNSIRAQRQTIEDLRKTVTNWIDQSRENADAMKQWRGAFYTLAGGIGAAVGLQVWVWVRG